MFSSAANIAEKVDFVFALVLGISIFFMVLITTLLVVFVLKYRRSRHPKAENIRGNTALEITWTVIPTILVLIMFYYGWISFGFMRKAPPGAMEVKVTGRMWSWLFEYENGIQSDTLYVPYGKPVKLILSSQDVIHSLFIPAFRVKQDVVPGMTNSLWFTAQELGTYDILCAEYCGLQHAYMLAAVKVVPEEEFLHWYETNRPEATQEEVTAQEGASSAGSVKRGERLVRIRGCIACHSTDGSPRVSPSFKGLYGSTTTVITGDKERQVVVDDEYIRRSMLEPNADIVKGFQPLMPSQKGVVTEEEIRDIIAYIKSLK
jgi:cytochrome c oxidase subunit 2